MKKFLSFVLAVVMLLSLAACGGSPKAADSDAPSAPAGSSGKPTKEPSATPTPEPTPTSEPTPTPEPTPEPASYELTSVEGFVNGWARIEFRDSGSGNYYNGVIDAKGKLRTYYNTRNISASYMTGSGRFYGQQGNTYYVIDTKGQIHTYPEVQEVYSGNTYADGYRYVTERKSGFDAVEYITHIYDPDGTELTSVSGNPNVGNAGEGIFLIANNDVNVPPSTYYKYGYDLYFAQSDTWVREQVVNSVNTGLSAYKVEDGIFVYYVSPIHDNVEADNGEVRYADVKGKTYSITIPKEYGERPYYLCAASGILLFWDAGAKNLYCYNAKTSQWTLYQGSYQDKIDGSLAAGDGYIALPLRGADGKAYWVLLNDKLEDITQPTLGTARKIENGAVYVETSNGLECYDYKGNLLSTFKNWWHTTENNVYRGIESGVVCVTYDDNDNNRTIGYYKTDGTPAFEIDFSTGTEVADLGF